MESLAGAVFVDSGFDAEVVWKVFKGFLEPIVSPSTLQRHPTSVLVETVQKKGYGCPQFEVKEIRGGKMASKSASNPEVGIKKQRKGSSFEIRLVLDGVLLGKVNHNVKSVGKKLLSCIVLEKIQVDLLTFLISNVFFSFRM